MKVEDYSKKYDSFGEFCDNLIWVESDGLYGLINERGEEVVPLKYKKRQLDDFYKKYKDEYGYANETADERFLAVYSHSQNEKDKK